jgi:hypothetical protein
MNERLQNLAREAGHFEFNKWDYFDINKFAELIVRECAVIVGSMEEPHQDIAKLVKEHFGVEE